MDAREVRSRMFHDGFVVFEQVVATDLCDAVMKAIGDELGVCVDDPTSWDRVSSELDEVPLRGHQSQWDIRQLPELHEIWTMIWGTPRLWVDRNACRFTPPWRDGRAGPLAMHWDVDPRDRTAQWFPGVLALTDTSIGSGGFCSAPRLLHDSSSWPADWTARGWASRDVVIEVPLRRGDLLVFDSHLVHGTVRNDSMAPRAVFYVQMFPEGSREEAASNIADHEAGVAPPWWRGKPGHDRVEPGPPAELNTQGRRLLGYEPWP